MRVTPDVSHRKPFLLQIGGLTQPCSQCWGETDWLWGPRKQMGRGTRRWTKTRNRVSFGFASTYHFHTGLWSRVITHILKRGSSQNCRGLLFMASYLCLWLHPLNINYAAQCSTPNPCCSSPTLQYCSLCHTHTHGRTTECLSLFPFMAAFSTIHSQRQHFPPSTTLWIECCCKEIWL